MADGFRFALGVLAALVAVVVGLRFLWWMGGVVFLLMASLAGRWEHRRHGTTCGRKIRYNGPCDRPMYHLGAHEYTATSGVRIAFGGDSAGCWSHRVDIPPAP
jgi:hypothetical protein